jgi:hypothetical protein
MPEPTQTGKRFGDPYARTSFRLRRQSARRKNVADVTAGKMCFKDALALHLSRLEADLEARRVKPATLHYWRQVFAALLKSWPGLEAQDIWRVTAADCEKWARQFARNMSATRFNNTIAGLRHVFDVALNASIIYTAPPAQEPHKSVSSNSRNALSSSAC